MRRRCRRRRRSRCACARSLARTHVRPCGACTLCTKTDLVARNKLGLTLRVADQCTRTRWPYRVTVDVRWRLPAGSRNRVTCAQVLPGETRVFLMKDHAAQLDAAFQRRRRRSLCLEVMRCARWSRERGGVAARQQCTTHLHDDVHSKALDSHNRTCCTFAEGREQKTD